MYYGFIDVINTIFQSMMFIVGINYCVDNKYKKNKMQILIITLIMSLIGILGTKIMGNSSLSIILNHILMLLFLVCIIYRQDKLNSTIALSIIYLIISISGILSFIIFMLVINNTNSSPNYANIMIMYLPQLPITYIVLKNMKVIYKIYLIIKSRISSILALIISTLILDFIMSFSMIVNDKDNPLFKEIIFLLLGVFIIFVTWYFASINKKSNEIYKLNAELEKKINELRKVKHDYGSQISYLYGAYLMNNYEKIGELLKSIIEGNNISTQVKVFSSEDSFIYRITKSINLKNVDLLIDEDAKLEDANINEMDLQRIISNIVRNSIEALGGSGLLMIKTFYNYNNIVISIKNNGPEIDKNIINNIFKQGFSTKENKDGDNGFGLYIVQELINKYNGDINVASNEALTEFVISLPLCIK